MATKKMTKKALREILNENGYHNNHNLSKKGQPLINFNNAITGRGLSRSATVSLSLKGFKFKNLPWYDFGSLQFEYSGKDKTEAIKSALARAEKYIPEGDEFVESPFGGFVLKSAFENAMTTKFSWDE